MRRSILPLLALSIVGCSIASTTGREDIGNGSSALSFASGNNDGYCASNPSAQCWNGSPVAAKTLALTFDDGPGSQTLVLSSWLKSQGIRATFFVNGHCFGAEATNNGQCQQDTSSASTILSQVIADGHLVGNHTQDHLDLTTLSDSQIVSELVDTDAIISPFVSNGHYLFRAPYGSWSSHDYDVLHASSMDKYVGPVKWDIGGAMTSSYAADWDCWQNDDGYGVMTTKECGDRYLQEITDVGRGITLMHDADYGDVSNHNLTSGEGNTIDMVKYLIPLLKQQGYSFVRLDEVPDIEALLPEEVVDAGVVDSGVIDTGKTDASVDASIDAGGSCVFNPTWQQTSYANDWWIEYTISGNITSASLEVVGGAITTLSDSNNKWVGSPSSAISSGTQVIVHATNSSNQTAKTQSFGYLVSMNPTTACSSSVQSDAGSSDAGLDAGKDSGVDAGKDAGVIDAGKDSGSGSDAGTDSGSCTNALNPTWSQGSGANNWWVEYAITTNATIASASLEVVGSQTVPLSLEWNKWVGSANASISNGASVIVHAQDTLGNHAQTLPFGYLSTTNPKTQTCSN